MEEVGAERLVRDAVSPSLWGKIRKAYREGGLGLVAVRARKVLLRSNSAWWYVRDLSRPVAARDCGLDVRVSREAPGPVVEYMRRKEYLNDRELREARRSGHWFVGLYEGGGVAGFCKCGFTSVYVNDFGEVLTLPPHVAFIYEYEIDERLRGRGVGGFFVGRVLEALREAGFRHVICHVPPWNKASMKVVERCGFEKVGYIRFVEVAGLKFRTGSVETILASLEKGSG
ncbi:MAG TPA: N-acetyltransferase [Deltaproteobacteria bacterium]|nr:N-acetyltransferase [Deltaproteobacteria bacterium]